MATITWTNTDSDGDMNNPNNWDLSRVPTSGDDAQIPSGNGAVTGGSLNCDSATISVYVFGGDFYCPVSFDMQAGNTYIQGGTFHETATVLNVSDRGISDGTFMKGIQFPSSVVYGTSATWPDAANVNANAAPYGPTGTEYYGQITCDQLLETVGGAGGCIPLSAVTGPYGGTLYLSDITNAGSGAAAGGQWDVGQLGDGSPFVLGGDGGCIYGPNSNYHGGLGREFVLTTAPYSGDYIEVDPSNVAEGVTFGPSSTLVGTLAASPPAITESTLSYSLS